MTDFDLFDRVFGTWEDEIAYNVATWPPVPWADFWLNPRALRGSDFLMRWLQGYWSEERLRDAVNATGQYYAIPWGPSGAAPDSDPRSTELYLLRLQEAGLGTIKRPDLLVFRGSDRENVNRDVDVLGGTENLPFTSEDAPEMRRILSHAIVAIECENSLWVARQMPDFGTPMKPMARLGGKYGLKKNAVLPTVIIKDEDRDRLRAWQAQTNIPIHVWHVFYDLAYGIAFDEAERLIAEGLIEPRQQVFQASGGATTTKATYNTYYHYAYELAVAREEPRLLAESITDKNGHVLPYVRFEGGSLTLAAAALDVLETAEGQAHHGK